MEIDLDIPYLPITEQQKGDIHKAVFGKSMPFRPYHLLMRLMDALRTRGFELPSAEDIEDKCGAEFEQLELPAVMDGSKDLFTILAHPVFSGMFRQLHDNNGDQFNPAAEAWKAPYVGPTVRLLRDAINEMNSTRGIAQFANFVPIVQSSGMGKSRAVDELARDVFTLPLCLRPAKDTIGYPAGDYGIRRLLTENMSMDDAHIQYRVLFEKLFEAVRDELKSWPVHSSQEELAGAFRLWMCEHRAELYARVYQKTSIEIEHMHKVGQKDFVHARSKPDEHEDLEDDFWPESKTPKSLVKLIQEKSGVPPDGIVPQRNRSNRSNHGLHRRVWLVVYLDESQWLDKVHFKEQGGGGLNGNHILCSAVDKFRMVDMFVLLVTAKAHISIPPLAKTFAPSSRVRNETTPGVQAPFFELAFDKWGGDEYLLRQGKQTIESVCKPEFMVRFGRPLFWARYDLGDQQTRASIISFARTKLAGNDNDQLDEDGKLAVLGIRLGISFDEYRFETKFTEVRLMEHHMRIAHSVPAHREFIRTNAPSEPILAEAAAQLMCMHRMWDSFPEVLFDQCIKGLVSIGGHGKLLARLLLTKARDQAISRRHPDTQTPVFTQPILLADFLEELVGEENKNRIMDAKPDNMADGPSLAASALGGARLNFTHWAKAGDDGVVTDDAAWIALGRCMAWQCWDGQAELDMITPLILPPEDTKLGRYTVSAIMWKIRDRAGPVQKAIDAEALEFFTPYSADRDACGVQPEHANSRPYMTIALDLGALTVEPHAGSAKLGLTQSTSTRAKTWNGGHSTTPSHPRYAISISGCSHKTYPRLVSVAEESKYASLLPFEAYAPNHAKLGLEHQEAIANMKPYWKDGAGAMGSFDKYQRSGLSRLGIFEPAEEPREVLEVHRYDACGVETGELTASSAGMDEDADASKPLC